MRNSKPESIVWCCLALEQGQGHWLPRGQNYDHSKEPREVFLDFLGGLLIRSIYLGTIFSFSLLSYSLTTALPLSLDTNPKEAREVFLDFLRGLLIRSIYLDTIFSF